MKKILLILAAIIGVWACNTQKSAVKIKQNNTEVQELDSVEYDMETFDARFRTWYQMHNKPTMYHSKDYYEYWNYQYVSAWNENASDARMGSFFEPIVGYDQHTDYGLELNHKLFYYFQYVENVLKIKVLPGWGPKSNPF